MVVAQTIAEVSICIAAAVGAASARSLYDGGVVAAESARERWYSEIGLLLHLLVTIDAVVIAASLYILNCLRIAV